MKEELLNWKEEIKNLKNRLDQLKSQIQLEGENIQRFHDIISLIQSIINNQEEKLKEMQKSKRDKEIPKANPNFSLSDFVNILKETNLSNTRENRNATIIADKSNINYNKVNKNISEIIKQVSNEFDKQLILVEEINIKKNKEENKNKEINNNEEMMIIENNDKIEDEDMDILINKGLNPAELLLNIKDEINQDELIKSVKTLLDMDNCFVLPMYNLDKLLHTTIDLNSVQYDSSNAFFKIFPFIENDENKFAAKKLIGALEQNNNLNNINNTNKKRNIELEKNTRYNQFTPLQKLIILYGIFASGNNPSLVNCILNMYSPTHCLMFNNEEMNFICSKITEEIGIEFEYNFNNMKDDEIFNINKNDKFYLNNSQKIDIESSLFMTEFNDFKYNDTIREIYKIKEDKKGEEFAKIFNGIKNKDQYKLNYEFDIKNKNISLQKSINLIKIITKNPYIKNSEIKKNYLNEILQYLKSLCKTIRNFQEKNKSNYNYFTGEKLSEFTGNKRRINDMNYPEIIINKKKKLDKDKVLNILRENKTNIRYKCKSYSIKEIKKEIIKKEENVDDIPVKNKILNVINLYNQNNIKNEWEKNRKEWYQNNQRFNPIFKINERPLEERPRGGQAYDTTTIASRGGGGGDNPGPGRNDGNGGGNFNGDKNNNGLFGVIPSLHMNQ